MTWTKWIETKGMHSVVDAWEKYGEVEWKNGDGEWESFLAINHDDFNVNFELRYRLPWKLPDLVALVNPEAAKWLVEEGPKDWGWSWGYSEDIGGCILWEDTPQGHDYWVNINTAVEKIRACDCDLKGCEKCLPGGWGGSGEIKKVGTCTDCGAELELVRPGKTQCLECEEKREVRYEVNERLDYLELRVKSLEEGCMAILQIVEK